MLACIRDRGPLRRPAPCPEGLYVARCGLPRRTDGGKAPSPRHEPGRGASSRNAGQLGSVPGGDPQLLSALHPRRFHGLVRLAEEAVDFTEKLIDRHGIDCEYERTGNVAAAVSPRQLRIAKKKAAGPLPRLRAEGRAHAGGQTHRGQYGNRGEDGGMPGPQELEPEREGREHRLQRHQHLGRADHGQRSARLLGRADLAGTQFHRRVHRLQTKVRGEGARRVPPDCRCPDPGRTRHEDRHQ
ncbi:FAD-binding oxidoreductase [Streptomyces sp. TRM S81-3]|uniref:FAD-binding oxidoreductase n=1 Tax=Streptomyces griseicoloratus TaxID=2752516 RepID=A0A926QPN9_9ACTN|nr:FAD-binding oxidoreductase [Streptomyces griseicoloratus]